jgi:hypothetical protein
MGWLPLAGPVFAIVSARRLHFTAPALCDQQPQDWNRNAQRKAKLINLSDLKQG